MDNEDAPSSPDSHADIHMTVPSANGARDGVAYGDEALSAASAAFSSSSSGHACRNWPVRSQNVDSSYLKKKRRSSDESEH